MKFEKPYKFLDIIFKNFKFKLSDFLRNEYHFKFDRF